AHAFRVFCRCFDEQCVDFLYAHFFSHDPPTTEVYTLSLHDALPISVALGVQLAGRRLQLRPERLVLAPPPRRPRRDLRPRAGGRSEEHTSELQSLRHLVCRLLLEKKKQKKKQ